jgi:selenocysteine lyase/cysteine desulfurase
MQRRDLVKNLLALPLYASASASAFSIPDGLSLPDKQSFPFTGTYLNAAFTHPLCLHAYKAAEDFLLSRMHQPTNSWPRTNPRNAAVESFAALIHAAPAEVAVVPSTMGGENMLCAALALGPKAGVVTDALHYDASLAMYGELQKQGVPVSVAKPRDLPTGLHIDLRDLDALITRDTRLVAVSHIASSTGHQHDLKLLCDMAHAKGALVYADIVQSAGAIPIDVKQSGVDFVCCGTYKWLMGEFGAAFLYVRPARLEQLHRVQWGWRSLRGETSHVLPFDTPGPPIGDWQTGTSTASHFEVGSPDWSALAASIGSIGYIRSLGVENIQRYRQPLVDRLQLELPRLGFLPLTPQPTTGPTVAFAYRGAAAKFSAILDKAAIKITVSENTLRISPSVYNDMGDIERLLTALKS